MKFLYIKPDDSTAADVGAFVWTTMYQTMLAQGVPLPRVTDSDVFSALWAQGALKVFVARDGDALIGCRLVAYNSHIMSSDVMVAHGLHLWVDASRRREGVAAELVRFSNEMLTSEFNVGQLSENISDSIASQLFLDAGYKTRALMMLKG